MAILQSIQAWFVKPPRAAALFQTKAAAVNLPPPTKARRLVIENKQYIFGLEWRLLPPTRTFARTVRLARQEGMHFYVLSEMEDLMGVTPVMPQDRGPKYSAAMHLANKMSQGGMELYAFALPKGAYAVVAINESRPIPGFDFVGPFAPAKALIEEFQAIQVGHPVRGVGNAGLIEGEETIEPEDIFGEPAKSARIKPLPGTRSTAWLLGLGVLMGLGFLGTMSWLQQERKAVLAEVKRESEDPIADYKASLQAGLRALPPAGPQMLQQWLAAIEQLPTFHQGWRLSKVECNPNTCLAQWDRVFGTYADFNAHLPMYTVDVKEVQTGQDPLQATILTTHTAATVSDPSAPPSPMLNYKSLPSQQLGLRSLSTQFQALALLGPIKVSLSPPKLFGGTEVVPELNEGMASGDWSIEHDLWTLPEIVIAPNMVTKHLTMNLAADKGPSKTHYRLEGSYFVQYQKTP